MKIFLCLIIQKILMKPIGERALASLALMVRKALNESKLPANYLLLLILLYHIGINKSTFACNH